MLGTSAAPPPLSLRPLVRPTPLAALELERIPTALHFRRDHFQVPELDSRSWRLAVGGEVERPLQLSLADLGKLPRRSLDVVLECAGHRRAELDPRPAGVPWAAGAVAEATWSGVALADVLALARPRPGVLAAVLAGADQGAFEHVAADVPFARALPLAKALHPDTLLALEMNGEPLAPGHGAPARAVVPGWYATDAVKWLAAIRLVSEPFDGPFEAIDYRLPDPATGESRRMTEMPVHALVTTPVDGAVLPAGSHMLRGVAWGGAGGVARVEVAVDGDPWRPARLRRGGDYARVFWELAWDAPAGAHELAVRASDRGGTVQPDAPTWNPRGYGNASVHRARVRAG